MPFFALRILGGYELVSVEFGRNAGHDGDGKVKLEAGPGGSHEIGYTGVRDDEVIASDGTRDGYGFRASSS